MKEEWKKQRGGSNISIGLLFSQEPCGGDPSKTARAHCHIQAWARYRGLVEKYQKGH
jgi:hypothetical protein